ncbi:MAG: type 1 glutamine amidotransferase [Gammaproteobacteria bacterium]|nr:type 1 glutamine amidotransferase [Gammaproteobacteria bacterium]
MRTLIIQHVDFEGPAAISPWLHAHGHRLDTLYIYRETPLPDPANYDALIIMGGPMSVHDSAQLPWLTAEKKLIASMLRADKKVLGICLGGQLIADVLGTRVRPNHVAEIGWFPLYKVAGADRVACGRCLPETFTALHWHGETFELPANAVHLLRSDVCDNQACAIGANILALQFHLEMTPVSLQQLISACGGQLVESATVQSARAMLADPIRFDHSHALLSSLLQTFLAPTRDD